MEAGGSVVILGKFDKDSEPVGCESADCQVFVSKTVVMTHWAYDKMPLRPFRRGMEIKAKILIRGNKQAGRESVWLSAGKDDEADPEIREGRQVEQSKLNFCLSLGWGSR